MTKYLSALFIGFLLMTACSNEKETPNGLKYTVLEEGNGEIPKTSQVVVFNFVMKDNKDSLWASTYDMGLPDAMQIRDSSRIAEEDGMSQMFRQLSVGDCVTTTIPMKKFFKDMMRSGIPPKIDTTGSITYTIKIKDILSLEDFYKNREGWIFEHDQKSIAKYLSENNLTAQQDTSGLSYIMHTNGGGEKPTLNNCVEVAYSGRFLRNGQVFDQGITSFPLQGVIPGWRIGVPYLGKGDSATFFIPSKLAYGPNGIPQQMPPDAILIFDVKLLDIKGEYDRVERKCK
jgi:FKBP-type peptidyl-prolyl cis-trans isomerase